MDRSATEKAARRLGIARRAAGQLASAQGHQEFADYWYTLLTSSKSVWTILEQGAKSSAQSRQWFGAKKRERRSDELLQYMFEARNCDEHGLEAVVMEIPSYTSFEARFEVGTPPELVAGAEVTAFSFDPTGGVMHIEATDPQGKAIRTKLPTRFVEHGPSTRLAPIKDRAGKTIKPPEWHLGVRIPEAYPIPAAARTLNYLEKLIEEARDFHTP